jgi:hypothetical protein
MPETSEQWIMRPGDVFVAKECGCSFTVDSGPVDESMAKQAPRCCCGHDMVKQDVPEKAHQSNPLLADAR